MEITHKNVDGKMVQIVSPMRLRELLDQSGDDYSRPDDFGPDDEWKIDYPPEDPTGLDDLRKAIRLAVIHAIDATTADLQKPKMSDGELPALFRTLDAIAERIFLKDAGL